MIESGLEKSRIMNLNVNARGAEGFEQQNAADVKIGCMGIVEKICWVKKN